MNDPISLAETYDVLSQERVRTLMQTTLDVAEEWRNLYLPGLDETTRARAMGNRFYFHTAERLAADFGVYQGEHLGQRFVTFDDRLQLRFKTLKRGLTTSNFQTGQAMNWIRPRPLEGFLFDRLHFGYRMNLTGREIQDAFICRPTGNRDFPNAWVWQIWGNPIDQRIYGVQQQLGGGLPSAAIADYYLYEDYSAVI